MSAPTSVFALNAEGQNDVFKHLKTFVRDNPKYLYTAEIEGSDVFTLEPVAVPELKGVYVRIGTVRTPSAVLGEIFHGDAPVTPDVIAATWGKMLKPLINDYFLATGVMLFEVDGAGL